jgi:hypothetical protein
MANCVCGKCRVCKQRERRKREGRALKRMRMLLRDAEIQLSGPQLRLSCQMIDDYAIYFGPGTIEPDEPDGWRMAGYGK